MKIPANIFTHLSVLDSPKGSTNTFKTRKNISLYFKKKALNSICDEKYWMISLLIFPYLTRLKAHQILSRLVKISACISKEGT